MSFPPLESRTAALPDLTREVHGEILDVAPFHARTLVALLHGRFRAPVTDRCLAVCLGLSRDVLTPLMDTYGAALEIGDVLKLRAVGQLDAVPGFTRRHVHEIDFLLEAHRFLPARQPTRQSRWRAFLMADDISRLESLATCLDRLDISHEFMRVPSSAYREGSRDALWVFVRTCPSAGTPLRSVLVIVKHGLFRWGHNGARTADDPGGAALAIQQNIRNQETAPG